MTIITLENLGTVNKNRVTIGNLTLYFSYRTCVGFSSPKNGLIVSENVWSVTTGKLLNEIEPRKDLRYPNDAFNKMLDKAVKRHIKIK